MTKALTLISTLGIFTTLATGILVLAPESASALCVHNLTGGPIVARDGSIHSYAYNSSRLDPNTRGVFWEHSMSPDQKECCPAGEGNCPDEKVEIYSVQGSKGKGSCVRDHRNGLVEVRYKDFEMTCNVL